MGQNLQQGDNNNSVIQGNFQIYAMAVGFNTNKYEIVHQNARKFWDGMLGRPLIHGRITVKQTAAVESRSELRMFFDLDITAGEIVDKWENDLGGCEFLGDGFPYVRPMLASSAMAIYIDCDYAVSDTTIWFEPDRNIDLSKIDIRYNPDNRWFLRTMDIYAEALKRWNGKVQCTMTNLGGIYDIMAMIIPSEKLVYAMMDQPDEIKRLTWQAHEVWWQYYDEISRLITPSGIGYMDFWLPIPCRRPTFLLQCDFCSLLNQKFFDEFVKPELAESCRRMGGAMFHLDGPGAIRHLDSLLSIDELKLIQWVPGDGQKGVTEWPDLYKRVRDGGKRLMITGAGTRENFDKVVDQLGSSDGLCYSAWGEVSEKDEFQAWLEGYGVASVGLYQS
jgi:hypothetical protein